MTFRAPRRSRVGLTADQVKERRREITKRYRDRHKEQLREYGKKYNRSQAHKDSYRKYVSGWTGEEYRAAVFIQEGRCKICGWTPAELGLQGPDALLHADHNHKTGRKRGLLCGHCNRALGLFRDNPEILDRARSYVLVYDGD